MKVIFLDIDGVLNKIGQVNRTTTRWNGYIGMEPSLVRLFNDLAKKTGAKVVLSSSWRTDDDWEKTMRDNGLKCDFIGRTRQLHSESKKDGRGLEVKDWLDSHPDVKQYAILDDDTDFVPGQHLVKTNYEKGLTPEDCKKVEKYLA